MRQNTMPPEERVRLATLLLDFRRQTIAAGAALPIERWADYTFTHYRQRGRFEGAAVGFLIGAGAGVIVGFALAGMMLRSLTG